MDVIKIENLKIYAHHGVLDFEKIDGQNFYVNAKFYLSLQESGVCDDLDKTLNYAKAADIIESFLTANTYDLIETVAEKLAAKLLIEFPVIKKLELEIKKPEAPLTQEFDSVSVTIERMWHRVVIAYGSSEGDRERYISEALKKIADNPYCKILRESKMIKSEPYGGAAVNEFVNGAVLIETLYNPHMLLSFLHDVEKEGGRVRDIHWGDRTIDLDIIFYDDYVIDDDKLTVPHPDMVNREFVLGPCAEIVPNMIHPVLRRSVNELLRELTDV